MRAGGRTNWSGFNATRLLTVKAQEGGYRGQPLTVGRVQTPILWMVDQRTQAFRDHRAAAYFAVTGAFVAEGGAFEAVYQPTDADAVDEAGRLRSRDGAEAVVTAVTDQIGAMTVTTTAHTTPPPLPYNLIELQADAAKAFSLAPDRVLAVTQALRETHRLITYNRSDCRYLSDEQHGDAPGILTAVRQSVPGLTDAVAGADATLKGPCFNSDKVTAHHGIVPTAATVTPGALSEDEVRVYGLIARQYVAQFYPALAFDRTRITVTVAGRGFATSRRVTTALGWRALFAADAGEGDETADAEDAAGDLRALRGETATCERAAVAEKKTAPKALFTMTTLLKALTRAADYIDDPALKASLKAKDQDNAGEHGGIGTPATRSSIIRGLFDREYLVEDGRAIVSTDKGRTLLTAIPDALKTPALTAEWHLEQVAIEAGEGSVDAFLTRVHEALEGVFATVLRDGIHVPGDAGAGDDGAPPCPRCEQPLKRRRTDKGGTPRHFWVCPTGECHQGRPTFLEDAKGRPVVVQCNRCEDRPLLSRFPSKKKTGSFYWSCPERHFYDDRRGRPVVPKVVTCPSCADALSRRQRKADGRFFWVCGGATPHFSTTPTGPLRRPARIARPDGCGHGIWTAAPPFGAAPVIPRAPTRRPMTTDDPRRRAARPTPIRPLPPRPTPTLKAGRRPNPNV